MKYAFALSLSLAFGCFCPDPPPNNRPDAAIDLGIVDALVDRTLDADATPLDMDVVDPDRTQLQLGGSTELNVPEAKTAKYAVHGNQIGILFEVEDTGYAFVVWDDNTEQSTEPAMIDTLPVGTTYTHFAVGHSNGSWVFAFSGDRATLVRAEDDGFSEPIESEEVATFVSFFEEDLLAVDGQRLYRQSFGDSGFQGANEVFAGGTGSSDFVQVSNGTILVGGRMGLSDTWQYVQRPGMDIEPLGSAGFVHNFYAIDDLYLTLSEESIFLFLPNFNIVGPMGSVTSAHRTAMPDKKEFILSDPSGPSGSSTEVSRFDISEIVIDGGGIPEVSGTPVSISGTVLELAVRPSKEGYLAIVSTNDQKVSLTLIGYQ